jgi:hypothetical protein
MANQKSQQAAIDRMRSFISIPKLIKADRVAQINGRYIGLTRDIDLVAGLEASLASIAVTDLNLVGKPDKRRILGLVGESGAGKSTALFEQTSNFPAMQPYDDEERNRVLPLLAYNAPSPSTPQLLALAGLEALGYPISNNVPGNKAWDIFGRVLKANKVHWVLIDEAQHAIDVANRLEVTKIANSFKNLVQMPDWPVRLILAGVEPLTAFLSSKQLFNRKTIIHFEKMKGKTGSNTVSDALKLIVFEHATLATELHTNRDFINRLTHACDGDFGTIVQTVRSAVELAIYNDDTEVIASYFEKVYASFSGCLEHQNIFTAKNYTELVPFRAAFRDADFKWEAAQSARRTGRLKTRP